MDANAHLFERSPEDVAPRRVELRVHEVRHQVDHVDLETGVQEPSRRLEAEEAAADHRGAVHAAHEREHSIAVGQRAEHEDAALEARRTALFPRRADIRRSVPSIGGMNGLLPVAMTRASYGSTMPPAPVTVRDVEIDGLSTRTPRAA